MNANVVALAMAAESHVESWVNRLRYFLRPVERDRRDEERRRNPRACVLCGGPMQPDRRPPRHVLYPPTPEHPEGEIRSLPEEVLVWYRCGRCKGSQVGVHP